MLAQSPPVPAPERYSAPATDACLRCGNDLHPGYIPVPGTPGQAVCVCCAWLDDAELHGWLGEPPTTAGTY